MDLLGYAALISFTLVPVAIGFAVLRYRLYDIDIIVNGTLVYGTLCVLLVLVYVGSVVGSQYLSRALAGQESQLAIVASTLAIAALFNPLRRRVQTVVDRLFYRSKYDAAYARSILREAARRDGFRRSEFRTALDGTGDDAAGARLVVAEGAGEKCGAMITETLRRISLFAGLTEERLEYVQQGNEIRLRPG